ncbi:hypothetical protein SAMN02745227_01177 [Anaerobranca californiensis DSM 14826]|jgi:PHP family Zn ribbon phosphoesterase|uniref:Polymerase/histidinol phosphatase N-terminal domain-containing protein n=1 Tax=Anaerobranca californiensis DSM 14826 TaxID=1120989 RepID=A0A1M6NLU2_9FIRM|nr:PHP domain-containing protein [Anaerobranca californiensis]SHJ96693.1 hypothetical protein SAMN02745227_01177 [Anaerobranca californiensis DSM 14826]
MLKLKGQLHIHSVLSPCASLEMGPKLIIQRAKELGLDFIGITDHNSTKNLKAFSTLCQTNNLYFLPGIEVETKEEVHVLCYFNDLEKAEELGSLIYETLLPIPNDPELFGYQVLVDEKENILGFEDKLLLQRSSLGIAELAKVVEERDGVCIPAHIDRAKNGLLKTLGFIPEEPLFSIFEVSKNCDITVLKDKYSLINKNLFKGCDAHRLEELEFEPLNLIVKGFSLKELLLALQNKDGRRYFQ